MNAGLGPCYGSIHECFAVSVSLREFTFWRTMQISEPSFPSPWSLYNIREPFTTAVACTLIAISMTVTLIFIAGRESRLISNNILFVSAGLCLQVCVPRRMSGKILVWYSAWLLLAWHLSSIYMTVLQSSSIVPGLQESKMTVEEMLEQNFSFFASASQFIKTKFGNDQDRGFERMSFIRKEKNVRGSANSRSCWVCFLLHLR